MKAVQISQYGTNDVVQVVDVEIPTPSPGEVLVKVHASGVNPIDWKIRDGVGERMGLKLPIIMGGEFAGEITKLGEGVREFKVGDAVYGMVKVGGFAEYVCAKVTDIALKPSNTDFKSASGISLVGLTAWQALFDFANLKSGQKILITGASGAVGSMAVQFAKSVGAYVVGTASGKNKDFLLSLGVDQFINYETQNFETIVKDMDVVFDTAGGQVFDKSYACVRRGGQLVTAVAFPKPELATEYGIEVKRVFCKPNSEQLQKITDLVEAGKVTQRLSKVFPLTQVKEALELSQSGKANGKIVLTM